MSQKENKQQVVDTSVVKLADQMALLDCCEDTTSCGSALLYEDFAELFSAYKIPSEPTSLDNCNSPAASPSGKTPRTPPRNRSSTPDTGGGATPLSRVEQQETPAQPSPCRPTRPTEPVLEASNSNSVAMPDSGASNTLQLELSEDQWKVCERRTIERKLAKQFEGVGKTTTYAVRKTKLGKYPLPRIYTYAEQEEHYYIWEEKDETEKKTFATHLKAVRDIDPKICNSKHFKRVEHLRKHFQCKEPHDNPNKIRDCLYYAILILPGVPEEYKDQGYVGIVGNGSNLFKRWREHTGDNMIVDQNKDLLERYCDGKYEVFSQHAAIFALGRPKCKDDSIPLDIFETYLMNVEFCVEHGCRATGCCKQHTPENNSCSCSGEICKAMCECEKICQKKGCRKECICLTDMRYGMNAKTKPSSKSKDKSKITTDQLQLLLEALGIK